MSILGCPSKTNIVTSFILSFIIFLLRMTYHLLFCDLLLILQDKAYISLPVKSPPVAPGEVRLH